MVGSEKGSFGGFLAEKWRFLVWGFGVLVFLASWNFGILAEVGKNWV